MGLPSIEITFRSKAVTAVQRSELGIVALVLQDDTNILVKNTTTYKDVSGINTGDWSADNLDYIQKTFEGTPKKVICIRIPVDSTDYNEAFNLLKSMKWNYLAIPQIIESEVDTVASWIKSKRLNDKKTFKAVLPNIEADNEGIINFTTDEIETSDKVYSTAEYCSRIAGIMAGLPFTRSSTYFELNEVLSIKEHDDPDKDIDNGQLILINDGENIKIGRGVNSLTTFTIEKAKPWSKIKVLEVMDLIQDDIRDTFNKYYIGKVINVYDNQVLFFTSINAYFKTLAKDNILDKNFENKADVDVESQRLAWEGIGTDTSEWDDIEVKNMTFEDMIFAKASVKILDAVEGLAFDIAV